jgi:vacuolar-type H+-ATPase subunit H
MKQTAIQFLLSHLWTTDWVNYTQEEKLQVIEEAKEMEKQQIIDAYIEASENPALILDDAEQYYNETFKK